MINALPRSRVILTLAVALWLAHIAVVAVLGAKPPGPIWSEAVQLALGALLIYAIQLAVRASEGLPRSFWRLASAAYVLWFIAESLGLYNDFIPSPTAVWISNILFCFWFVPLALALLLDPEREAGRLDAVVALDFMQAVLFCVAAYVYFYYLPKSGTGELPHEVWAPYFFGYGFVALAFILRGLLSSSRDIRILFGRIGAFLALSGCVDAFADYGAASGFDLGIWLDPLWSALLIVPLVIVVTWKQTEAVDVALEPPRRERRISTEIFYLFYPVLVLFMSLRIARERLGLAAAVLFLSFAVSSARLLITQSRLVVAKDALRREASRDGLTGLWNHKAILEILARELLRGERHCDPVGLIMADVDNFKLINDTRGHAAGDIVLRIISSAMAAVVRPYDSVGRYGGEEFLIVAPGCGLAETWELAERVRTHIAACSIVVGGEEKVSVSLSLGIAAGEAANDSEKLLHAADAALYHAKNAGRNRVEPRISRAASAGSESGPASDKDFWL
jgi:diguanylate cyclase (GGDEF)-like protein